LNKKKSVWVKIDNQLVMRHAARGIEADAPFFLVATHGRASPLAARAVATHGRASPLAARAVAAQRKTGL
jgi:hypothetical protein